MKIADLKYQSATPSSPSPNTLGVYANSGNAIVFSITSGGAPRQLGVSFTGVLPQSAVSTGQGVIGTGTFFGSTGNGIVPATGLCAPAYWLSVYHPNGMNLAIPAYLLR